MRSRLPYFLLALAPLMAADKITGGNGTLYLGGRPGSIFIIDEATEKVVGEIPLKTGAPIDLTLSQDRKRFYLLNIAFEDFEIVDLEQKKSIDTFRLSEGNKKTRIFGFAVDPLNRYVILTYKTGTVRAFLYRTPDGKIQQLLYYAE